MDGPRFESYRAQPGHAFRWWVNFNSSGQGGWIHVGLAILLALSGMVVAFSESPIKSRWWPTVIGVTRKHSSGKLLAACRSEKACSARSEFSKCPPIGGCPPNIYSLSSSFDVPYFVCSQSTTGKKILGDAGSWENRCPACWLPSGIMWRFCQSCRQNIDLALYPYVIGRCSAVVGPYAPYHNRNTGEWEKGRLCSQWNKIADRNWLERNVSSQFIRRLSLPAPPQSDSREEKGGSEKSNCNGANRNGSFVISTDRIDESIKPILFILFVICAPGVSIFLVICGGRWLSWTGFVLILVWAWCCACFSWALLQRGREQEGNKNGEHPSMVATRSLLPSPKHDR